MPQSNRQAILKRMARLMTTHDAAELSAALQDLWPGVNVYQVNGLRERLKPQEQKPITLRHFSFEQE